MKKHFRDSWDVWREKVNAALGTVEQIDASEVLFDNDDTDLTANDVQDAIEEVNTKANTIALDISQLSASHIGFVAGETGMTAENVQDAIEELNGELNNIKAVSAATSTLNVTTIDTVEGDYAFTGSGTLNVCEVVQIGTKHLIKIDIRTLSLRPTTLVGEVGGAVKFNNKTPLENINTLLNTEFTTLVPLGGIYKFSEHTYADATKRVVATIAIGQSSHYLQCYMPDGNETFVVPPISWLVWCS